MPGPWATVDDARAPGLWPDAGAIDDATLTELLQAAYEECAVYLGDTLAALDPPPERYRQANIMQARERWQSYRRDVDAVGFGDIAVRVQPLTPRVCQLLRPRQAVPVLGLPCEPVWRW